MALAREENNLDDIQHKSEMLNVISHLLDMQIEMGDEIEKQKETISKLEDDIRLLKKEKRWNMLWQNSLEEDINHTQIALLAVGVINVLFTFFMSR
ncbi:hypothetical protein JNUCC76_08650 [Leuconostoc sp. JNUCC 76]